jgi:putative ABC transport system permease protein
VNLARLTLSDLRARALSTTLNVVVLALAIATVILVLLVSRQLEERLERDAAGIDLVIGARGSATQLVLSALYELDEPPGEMPAVDAQRLSLDLAVRTAIPIALGDNYWGYRIVGTTHAYPSHYGARLHDGRLWQAPFEAVLGADVAARMSAGIGSTFEAAHGVRGSRQQLHENSKYKVVGVLAHTGTVVDRLVLTDVASIARSHAIEAEADESALVTEPPVEDALPVTALLVKCISTEAATSFANRINSEATLQATAPAAELDRLFRFIGVGREVLWGFAILLVLSAGVSSFIALYDALTEHRQELAIMRVLGAGPRKLMALLLMEGVGLAAAGAALGLMLGHVFTSALGVALTHAQHVSVTGWTWYPAELWVVALALAVGLAAAILPAWRARGIDIAATLAR